jgi:uncharacterized membrane protein (UPF0127 family)
MRLGCNLLKVSLLGSFSIQNIAQTLLCSNKCPSLHLKIENQPVIAHLCREMKRFGVFFIVVALGVGVFGCRPSATSAPPVAAVTNSPAAKAKPQGTPQAKLPTIKLNVGGKTMISEIAADDRSRQMGMMFREKMGENDGMIFVFPFAFQASFWMRNTTVPLSAAYIDPRGVIVEIHKLEPLNEESVRATSDQIQYVLETPEGWFEKNDVKVGAVVSTEHGPLAEVLKTNR